MAVSNKQLMAMKKAGMTDAEIQQVLLDDKAVDRGQIMEWDLPPEEHKKAMKYLVGTWTQAITTTMVRHM